MKSLDELRIEINQIDQELLQSLQKRIDVVKQIGQIKKQQGLAAKDPQREEQLISKLAEQGNDLGIKREVIEKVWKTLFEISYKIEE